MSKDEILKSLNDKKSGNDIKKLLEFCKQPRTPLDVDSNCKTKKDVFNVLSELRAKGAVDFQNGKYVITKDGLEALNSS